MWVDHVIGRSRSVRRVRYFQPWSVGVRNFPAGGILCFALGLEETYYFVETVINDFAFVSRRFTVAFEAVDGGSSLFAWRGAAHILVRSNGFEGSFPAFFCVCRISSIRVGPLGGVYVIR